MTSIGSRDGWQDMRDFIDQVDDADRAERLDRAIRGRGAFRRFRDELRDDEPTSRAFQRFADERQRGRARAWLAMHGLRPTGRP